MEGIGIFELSDCGSRDGFFLDFSCRWSAAFSRKILSHEVDHPAAEVLTCVMGDTRPVAQADGRGFSKLEMEESGGESRPPVVSARMENGVQP
ncbi:hypothetical protein PRIPAC_83404 [Pristionchus pacificus]|uniref:Uncharacterized protein n=1 Tax=Pristionchus pacificus TaxID=54126 RepID=A0A2A6BMP5_PRIPA|nr:hypothetical protein PRIPAC_83404 [Pristionchus pacificus]|eukprot:PDM67118.1 hypothetical protein PRIPAC_48535 [Pristionchus pacificus]